MVKVGIIRCEKNIKKCPLTSCFRSLQSRKEGFQIYDDCELMGVFTCECPGDIAEDLAKILKAKGAEAIHFCTCTFAKKTSQGWVLENGGFCDNIDQIIEQVYQATNLPCIKGTAHLPEGYEIQIWN